jgi:hypothetical protein
MLSPKFVWNDYFSGSPETTLNSTQYSSRQTFSVSSVYVSNCLFNKCTITSGHGGALYCTSSVTYLFVESSAFFSCKTSSGSGGAIYSVNSNNLQSVLYAVCSYDCCATSIGPFAYILVKNIASSKNYANYTSIARCVDDTSRGFETLCLQYGVIFSPSVNFSMNKCKQYSGVVYIISADSSSITSSMSYSSFSDNNATEYNCIWFVDGGTKIEIKSCNILRNTQALSTYGTIYTNRNMIIEDSCILENSATYIFHQGNPSYTITLSNCTVDSTLKTGNLVTQNTVTKSFILALHHMSTQNCHSEYDSAGTLTAIPHVSHPTKKLFCHTCQNHYQARINIFVSLIGVFTVTFIHSNQF